jgi:DNA-binding transcriptional LysR family regulator
MDRLCAVVPPGHQLAKKRSTTVRELSKLPLIVMGKDSSARMLMDQGFDREGLVPIVAYEVTYASSVSGMTAAGLGVGILPESVAGASRLRVVPIRNETMRRRIGIVIRAGRSLSPTADKLKQMLELVARR